jgi:hypothetical protein
MKNGCKIMNLLVCEYGGYGERNGRVNCDFFERAKHIDSCGRCRSYDEEFGECNSEKARARSQMSENDVTIDLRANEDPASVALFLVGENGARLEIALKKNGDILVNERFVRNDIELVDALDEWITKVSKGSFRNPD